MNRRTRRARRRLRRGDAPEPLLLITDDRPDLIEWIELLGRVGYRYRSELAPARRRRRAAARRRDPARPRTSAPWWVPLVGARRGGRAVLAAGRAAAAPDRTRLRRRRTSSPAAGGSTAATHSARTRHRCRCCCWPARSSAASRGGPTDAAAPRSVSNAPSPRGRDIIAAIGLPGSRVMSAVVDRWGWRARIGLPPGTDRHRPDQLRRRRSSPGCAPARAPSASSPTPTAPTTPSSAS